MQRKCFSCRWSSIKGWSPLQSNADLEVPAEGLMGFNMQKTEMSLGDPIIILSNCFGHKLPQKAICLRTAHQRSRILAKLPFGICAGSS